MDLFALLAEYSVRTTFDTSSAEHALVMIHADAITERDAPDAHYRDLPMIGSPALGIVISPTFGSMVRIAASSLHMERRFPNSPDTRGRSLILSVKPTMLS